MISPQAIIATIKVNCLRRPLWRDHLVMEALDVGRVKMKQMIENGRLPWVWDVGNDGKRRELRILGYSVMELLTGPVNGIGRSRDLKLPEILKLINLPNRNMRAVELQRLFWCGEDMIRIFDQRKELTRIPENLPKQGPNASPRYTLASIVRFLEQRRMT